MSVATTWNVRTTPAAAARGVPPGTAMSPTSDKVNVSGCDTDDPGMGHAMPTFSRSVDADRPIAEVWDVWTDVRILPQLSPSTAEVLEAPERLSEVGQTFRQVVRAVGRCFDVPWTVTSIVDRDHLTIEGSIGLGVNQKLTERVTSLTPTRTRMTIDVEYKLPFGPFGRLASKLGVEQLARHETTEILDRLKRRIESTPVRERGA